MLFIVSTSMIKITFKKLDFHYQKKKSPNKRMLFQVDRKSVCPTRNEEFVQEYVSTRRKNCWYWQKYLKKSKKIVSNSSDKSFK